MIILNDSSSPALSLSNCLRGVKERTDIGTGYSEAFDRSSSKTWKPGMYLRRGLPAARTTIWHFTSHPSLHLVVVMVIVMILVMMQVMLM